MGIDWNAIKTEYITTDTSYRKLARKYGVHYNAVANRAKREGWIPQRNQYCDNTVTKAVDAICDSQVDRTTKLLSASDRLMERVVEYMDRMEFTGFRDAQSMKQLSGVLKDLKEIQMIRSSADMREQEARIRNLERMTESGADGGVVVEMGEEVNELSG